MLSSFRRKVTELLRDKTYVSVLAVFIAAKIIIFSLGVAGQVIIPDDISNKKHVTDNVFLNPWAQYDSRMYLDVVENGYRDNGDIGAAGTNYHFYPLYPLLIYIFGFIGYPLAAFIIANAASFGAITLLYILVKSEFNDRIAKRTALYIILFPTAYYFTAMYTEALFLFLSLATFYSGKREKWVYAGIFGFLTSLARGPGFLLVIPLGYMYLRSRGFDFKKLNIKVIKPDVSYLILIPLGFLTFMFYHHLVLGNAFAQFESFRLWGTRFAPPWEGLIFTVNSIFTDHTLINVSYHIFNLFLTILFIFAIVYSFKVLKMEYTLYALVGFLPIFLSAILQGLPRYSLMIFPVFMSLAIFSQGKNNNRIMLFLYVLFALLTPVLVILHANERFVSGFIFTELF